MTTLELSKAFPEAFKALPEPYQNDSCLKFWLNGTVLFCAPKDENERKVLGDWFCVFSQVTKAWTEKKKYTRY